MRRKCRLEFCQRILICGHGILSSVSTCGVKPIIFVCSKGDFPLNLQRGINIRNPCALTANSIQNFDILHQTHGSVSWNLSIYLCGSNFIPLPVHPFVRIKVSPIRVSQPLKDNPQIEHPLGDRHGSVLQYVNAQSANWRKAVQEVFTLGNMCISLLRLGQRLFHKFNPIRQVPELLKHPLTGGRQEVLLRRRRIAGLSRIGPAHLGQSFLSALQLEPAQGPLLYETRSVSRLSSRIQHTSCHLSVP